jgi:hypothetical protein
MNCSITQRQTKSGMRYVVRFRLGGRASPAVSAGSFRMRTEAQARVTYIRTAWASGRDPQQQARSELTQD